MQKKKVKGKEEHESAQLGSLHGIFRVESEAARQVLFLFLIFLLLAIHTTNQ